MSSSQISDPLLSALGKSWHFSEPTLEQEQLIAAFRQRYNLSELCARLLSSRGIALKDYPDFAEPRIRRLLPDPFVLKDMERAVRLLADALEAKKKIALFGDYDVDGATSLALFTRLLRTLGHEPLLYIPNRLTEGYGPNSKALGKLRDEGAEFLVTLDCGTTAFDCLEESEARGCPVLVLDHHLCEARLPKVSALVNPNRLDDGSGLGHMAAVGVTFVFWVALLRELRQRKFFEVQPEPTLLDQLDLVALGTVCDVVPLVGLNRAFVSQGLRQLQGRKNPGLAALMNRSELREKPTEYHAGFVLGPRLNAGGRMGQSDLATRLLLVPNEAEGMAIAETLDELNQARKSLEQTAVAEALRELDDEEDLPAIALGSGEWHAGVTGIVAARLSERYHCPAFVFAFDEEGPGKGSGRSVPGLDLGRIVRLAVHKGLVEQGGGHAQAAGVTLRQNQLDAFRGFLEEECARAENRDALRPELKLDAVVHLSALQPEFLEELSGLAPFGQGNPEPRFATRPVLVRRLRLVGSDHLAFFAESQGPKASLPAIAFNAHESPLGELLRRGDRQPLSLAGRLREDRWRSARQGLPAVQFQVIDARLSEG